jgi:uncharacterized protein
MKRLGQILICCCLAAVATGCASSPPPRFYTLSCSPAAPAVAQKADCSVSVGPVTVPPFVDRRQIVLRTGPNQVFIDEFNRWASPLREDIGRVVVENLVTILGTPQVSLYSQSPPGASSRVPIDVLRFDSELGKAATLDAIWVVGSARDGQFRRGRSTMTETAQDGGYAGLVAAHSRALEKMSLEIAGKIQEMEGRRP